MSVSAPLHLNDTDVLLARKDELVAAIGRAALEMGIAIDYSFDMMLAARESGAERTGLLEMLLELEAIKYTLCARRLREEQPE